MQSFYQVFQLGDQAQRSNYSPRFKNTQRELALISCTLLVNLQHHKQHAHNA